MTTPPDFLRDRIDLVPPPPGVDGDCWIFTGPPRGNGYGSCYDPETKRTGSPHRILFRIANGGIPPGTLVCHRCDRRRCCNPQHLYGGSHQDNVRDIYARGRRTVPGEACRAKLNRETAKKIRLLANRHRWSQTRLAIHFQTSRTTIRKILARESYR